MVPSKSRLQNIFSFMLIEISSCAERQRRDAMHLRGTHCGRSGRKNQINRAQSRWNNGTARGEAELSVEEIIAGAFAGSVHTTSLGMTATKSIDALAATGVTGRGTASGADGEKQQALWQPQQLRAGWPMAEVV
jgi:hypothetical protein